MMYPRRSIFDRAGGSGRGVAVLALALGLAALTACERGATPGGDPAAVSPTRHAPAPAATTDSAAAVTTRPAPVDGTPEASPDDPRNPPPDRLPGADELRSRAATYWTALTEEDWAEVFMFQDPRDRVNMDEQKFIEWSRDNDPFVTHEAHVRDVIAEGEMGWVRLECKTAMRQFPNVPPREINRWEKWRVVQGLWFPVPKLELGSYPVSPALRDAEAERRLDERWAEAWALRMASDWEALHAMGTPEDQTTVPLYQFVEANSEYRFVGNEVFWTQVVDDRGIVRVRFTFELTDPALSKLPPKVIVIDDHWVLVDGTWYMDLTPPQE